MGTTATGKKVQVLWKKEAVYGEQETGNFRLMPIFTADPGIEQPLEQDNILSAGTGRDPSDPDLGVKDGKGTLSVPADVRYFGHWLQQLMGDAVTLDAKSNGTIKFSRNPVDADTITINGVVFNLKDTPVGTDIQIGADLKATLDNIVNALNASVDVDVDDATYSENGLDKLVVEHDVVGSGGDTFTLAASAATVSGATLSGGTSKSHVFSSGGEDLPSSNIEMGHSKVSRYNLNTGVQVNSAALEITRGGSLKATLELILQDEIKNTSTQGGTPQTYTLTKFSNSKAQLMIDDEVAGNITSGRFTFGNQLEIEDQVGREDGLINGTNEGETLINGNMTARVANNTKYLLDKSDTTPPTPVKLGFKWENNPGEKMVWTFPRVFVPRRKESVSGPGGIVVDFAFQGSYDSVNAAPAATVQLINDVAAYN